MTSFARSSNDLLCGCSMEGHQQMEIFSAFMRFSSEYSVILQNTMEWSRLCGGKSTEWILAFYFRGVLDIFHAQFQKQILKFLNNQTQALMRLLSSTCVVQQNTMEWSRLYGDKWIEWIIAFFSRGVLYVLHACFPKTKNQIPQKPNKIWGSSLVTRLS